MSANPADKTAQVAFSLKTRKPVVAGAAVAQDGASDNSAKKDDNDVVGEDELLSDGDKKKKSAVPKDCATRRRACKNCVCGRAEVEAKLIAEGKMSADGDDVFQPPPGGCGSCSKGDAFRCATCPFRGKPAWTAKQNAPAAGEGAANGAAGKVVLELNDDLDS